jgi:hypothetical protein
MAERRMFAKTIVDSDAFLDMPLSAQALYFHLSMRADDDGFVNKPKRVQKYIGASEDDLKLLIAKRFILTFDSGVIVIKHWKIHNYIQKDRYKPTVYVQEKACLRLSENNAYTECIQDGYIPYPQVRIGKVSIDTYNESIENNTSHVRVQETPSLDEVKDFCKKFKYPEGIGEKFFYYYESQRWQKNGEPLTNWNSLLHLWMIREKDFGTGKQGTAKYKEREYSDEEYESMFEDLKNIDL